MLINILRVFGNVFVRFIHFGVHGGDEWGYWITRWCDGRKPRAGMLMPVWDIVEIAAGVIFM